MADTYPTIPQVEYKIHRAPGTTPTPDDAHAPAQRFWHQVRWAWSLLVVLGVVIFAYLAYLVATA